MYIHELKKIWRVLLPALSIVFLLSSTAVLAQDEAAAATETEEITATVADEAAPEEEEAASVSAEFIVHNLWIMIAGMLVFIMHLGFATLESGLTRVQKHRQYSVQELHDYLHRVPDLSRGRFQSDVPGV